MGEKEGILVYPVIYETIPNGLQQFQLYGKGTFFTDIEDGMKFQEEMNRVDNKHAFWANCVIPYVNTMKV